jgi:hypothetical protein
LRSLADGRLASKIRLATKTSIELADLHTELGWKILIHRNANQQGHPHIVWHSQASAVNLMFAKRGFEVERCSE